MPVGSELTPASDQDSVAGINGRNSSRASGDRKLVCYDPKLQFEAYDILYLAYSIVSYSSSAHVRSSGMRKGALTRPKAELSSD